MAHLSYDRFSLDGVGNWISRGNNGDRQEIEANEVNAYTRFGDQSFTYDRNGNLTGDGRRQFKYDALTHPIPGDFVARTSERLWDKAAGPRNSQA